MSWLFPNISKNDNNNSGPSGKVKKNIGVVLGIGGGQKASHEFYSRLNYTVVEKSVKQIRPAVKVS